MTHSECFVGSGCVTKGAEPGKGLSFSVSSSASLSFVHKHAHELLGDEEGILLSAGSAGPILACPQPSVNQHGSAAGCSSQVGAGESLLGAQE